MCGNAGARRRIRFPDGVTYPLLSGHHDGYHKFVDQHAVKIGRIPPGAGLRRSGDVELKFAIQMRQRWERTGIAARESIVINHPDGLCRGRLSCDGLLRDFLPPGGELTVYWPNGKKTYRGETAQ